MYASRVPQARTRDAYTTNLTYEVGSVWVRKGLRVYFLRQHKPGASRHKPLTTNFLDFALSRKFVVRSEFPEGQYPLNRCYIAKRYYRAHLLIPPNPSSNSMEGESTSAPSLLPFHTVGGRAGGGGRFPGVRLFQGGEFSARSASLETRAAHPDSFLVPSV